jgi:hypothetical protein
MSDDKLTRPIIGIENRTPLEVFDIMCDRIRGQSQHTSMEGEIERLRGALKPFAEADFSVWTANIFANCQRQARAALNEGKLREGNG